MERIPQFSKGVHWYCVRSKPKKERSAAEHLSAQYALDVFAPQVRFRRKTKRGSVWFKEALFPGYLFVRFDLFEMKRAVSYAPGILNIPIFNGRVVPVPDAVIEALQADVDSGNIADASEPLQVGDETIVLEGSMRGFSVKVIKLMPAQQRVGVLMELMGTLVEAELPFQALEQRMRHPMSTAS